MSRKPPIAAQLFTLRELPVQGPGAVVRRIAESGIAGVAPVCLAGLPEHIGELLAGTTVDPAVLKPILDANGLVVCSSHTALPEPHNANAVFDEQELLGNDLLIISALNVMPHCTVRDFNSLDALKCAADRINHAAALAADRGMRIGYHNHYWEWDTSFNGRPGYEVFFTHLDPSVVAEVDIYWAQFAGREPADLIRSLGARAQLVHVKDGPLNLGEPMTSAGSGKADIAGALHAGGHLRWHIIEFDDCATDILDAVAASAGWLIGNHLSSPSS